MRPGRYFLQSETPGRGLGSTLDDKEFAGFFDPFTVKSGDSGCGIELDAYAHGWTRCALEIGYGEDSVTLIDGSRTTIGGYLVTIGCDERVCPDDGDGAECPGAQFEIFIVRSP